MSERASWVSYILNCSAKRGLEIFQKLLKEGSRTPICKGTLEIRLEHSKLTLTWGCNYFLKSEGTTSRITLVQ